MSTDSNLLASSSEPTTSVPRAQLCWIGFTTFVARSTRDIMRFFIMTIAPPAIMTALYCAIFGGLIGQRVGTISGIAYLQFIVPGLILMPVITESYSQAAYSLLTARYHRLIHEHLIAPQPSSMIVVSYVAGGVIRGILVGVFAGAAAVLIAHVAIKRATPMAGAMLLTSLLAALGGFISGLFAKSFEQLNWIPLLALTPLTYTSGVFYSLSSLPAWAQHLSLTNPLFYLVNLFRYSMLGVSDVGIGIGASVSFLALAVIGMFAIAVALVRRGVGIKD